MNTTENTPTHCHNCERFVGCRQAQNMLADTSPVDGFVYEGEIFCKDCCPNYGTPYKVVSDTPTHCARCGVPIIHELTEVGVEYVRDNLDGCCRELWPTVWADYGIQPHIPVDSIEISAQFQRLCAYWSGGQDCMLYAVSSTGGLTLGTHPPWGCDNDDQWYLTLWRHLSIDIGYNVRLAEKADYTNSGDIDDLVDFENWASEQVGRLEESYGLADWDASDG